MAATRGADRVLRAADARRVVEAARGPVRGRGHGRRGRARRRAAARTGRRRTAWRLPDVDFEGTARQTRGPINCPIASTESAVYYAVTAILDPGIAPNHGSYLPIEVSRPTEACSTPGLRRPSSAATCSRTASRPSSWPRSAKRFPSGRSPPTTATRTSTSCPLPTPRAARTCSSRSRWAAGAGGRASTARTVSRPGPQPGQQPDRARRERVPAEDHPLPAAPDSGGAGRFRGGLGAERTFELLADCELSTQFDRVKFPPPGLHGGSAGAAARILVERDGEITRASRQVERDPPARAAIA